MTTTDATTSPDDLLTPAEVAALFGVSTETIRRWVKRGRIPVPERTFVGNRPRWRMSTLNEHLKAQDTDALKQRVGYARDFVGGAR